MTHYDDAQDRLRDLPDPRTLSPAEQIAHAQVVAAVAQAEALHAVLGLLSRIGIALERQVPSTVFRGGAADLQIQPPTPPQPFRPTDPILSDDAI